MLTVTFLLKSDRGSKSPAFAGIQFACSVRAIPLAGSALVLKTNLMRSARLLVIAFPVAIGACTDTSATAPNRSLSDAASAAFAGANSHSAVKAQAGEAIFFDRALSIHENQSCASCHDPAFGFTGPNPTISAHGSVEEGSIAGRFAIRKPPSAAYASFSPAFHYDATDEVFIGGLFWDGRATGQKTGLPTADQALDPFLGAAEQALPDRACVVYKVSQARYGGVYRAAWGMGIDGIQFPSNTRTLCATEGAVVPLSAGDRAQVDVEYEHVAMSIAAFEASDVVNSFSSRYDDFVAGRGKLTSEELQGLALYNGKAGCAACHPSEGRKALFTDFTFDNIGIPANPENPALLATGFIDLGLGGFLGQSDLEGAQKVPTLRNLDKRRSPLDPKAFMHNGALKSIEQVVHFYNTRDVLPACVGVVLPSDPRFGRDCWPAPEVAANVNVDELGNLGLTPEEERLVVLYLKTLTDRK